MMQKKDLKKLSNRKVCLMVCSSVVLHTTVSAMSSGGIRTTHYQNITNDNRKHKR